MKIKEFDSIGLDRLGMLNPKSISVKLLSNCRVSFVLEGISRYLSTLICEMQDSYVQQSQRYVRVDGDAFNIRFGSKALQAEAEYLANKCLDLYNKMTELNDGVVTSGRPKKEDYKWGIPVEDARYILPLACKTNILVSISADRLIELLAVIKESGAGGSDKLIKDILKKLPENVSKSIEKYYKKLDIEDDFIYFVNKTDELTVEDNVMLIDSYDNLICRTGLGALVSTSKDIPYDISNEKAESVTGRVLGYGHKSIMEQAVTQFVMKMSLACYHQFIRHRNTSISRDCLRRVLSIVDNEIVIPKTIEESIFKDEFISLVAEVQNWRLEAVRVRGYIYSGNIASMLLNCEVIQVITTSNARQDVHMLKERTCNNAQWEIRDIANKKLKILRELNEELYKEALPSCCLGKCREGKLSCGKSEEVKKFFGIS